MHYLAKVGQFLVVVFGNQQAWLSGGGFGGFVVILVWVAEKLFGKVPSKRVFAYLFLVTFFVASCFVAWVDENDRVAMFTKEKDKALTDLQATQLQSAQKDGANGILQNEIRDQQGALNKCLVELGKSATPERLKIIALVFGPMAPRRPVKSSANFLLLTNRTITPIRLVVACQGTVASVDGHVLGSTMLMAGAQQRLAPNAIRINITSPAWTVTGPLVVTVGSDQDNLGSCNFDPE